MVPHRVSTRTLSRLLANQKFSYKIDIAAFSQPGRRVRRPRRLSSMQFTKRLRDGVRRGDITSSIRIWKSPRVKAGGRYRMEEGQIEVDSIEPIGFPDITPELARASGFLGVLDLLKVAKHGSGNNIYLVRFHYVRPQGKGKRQRKSG